MPIYSIEVQICATAYIKASSKRDAMKIANELKSNYIHLPDDSGLCGNVEICDKRFDDPALPNASLSPAMTIHGVWPGATPEEAEC